MDVFPDELPGLPPQRVVDFGIELHPETVQCQRSVYKKPNTKGSRVIKIMKETFDHSLMVLG